MSRKVALIMDSYCPHGADISNFCEHIKLLTLPPGCNSIQYHIDVGIVEALKKRYRCHMLHKMISQLKSRKERRDSCSSAPAGMRGTTKDLDPHRLDLTHMVKDS